MEGARLSAVQPGYHAVQAKVYQQGSGHPPLGNEEADLTEEPGRDILPGRLTVVSLPRTLLERASNLRIGLYTRGEEPEGLQALGKAKPRQ